MKKIILLSIALFAGLVSFSQSPTQFLGIQDNLTKKDPGPRNVWAAGAQASYNLASGDFIDNFSASGRALIEILGPKKDNYGVYLMGNLSNLKLNIDSTKANENSIRNILQTSQGINIGLYPHYIWGEPYGTSLTLFGNLGWKLNTIGKSDSLVYLHQARLSVGIELSGLRGLYSEYPTTLSIEPSISIFSESKYENVFNKQQSNLVGLDITLILPAGKGRGIMFDVLIPKNGITTFSVGLILNALNSGV
jgi:hypothetical protein